MTQLREASPPAFGQLLRSHRLAAGLTQEMLAERAGMTTKAVAALERGRRTRPRASTLTLLADALALGDDTRAAFIAAAYSEAPAPRVGSSSSRMYVPSTTLVGREAEVAAILHLLQSHRVVTLLGPGGIGKTRLALAAIASLEDRDPSARVATVDLSSLRDAQHVAPAIAGALGIQEAGGQGIQAALVSLLREQQLLLLLDNFEQVLGAAEVVGYLLASCPRLRFLITSRIPLRLAEEQRFLVPALATPDGSSRTAEELAPSSAVRLFVDRARFVVPGFDPDEEGLRTVAAICRGLDGLPLAIELAAARVRLLPLPTLLSRVQRQLDILTQGPRDLPARQQTMRATIEWSYQLLSPDQQQLLAQLAVFAGGATLDAVESICRLDGRTGVLEELDALVDGCLLIPTGGGTEPRFSLLQTIHEFAREQLSVQGYEHEVCRRHAEFFLRLAEEGARELMGPNQIAWLARLRREQGNLRAALTWALRQDDASFGLRFGAALSRFWFRSGMLAEGRDWLDSLLTRFGTIHSSDLEPACAEALYGAASIAFLQADFDRGMALGREALEMMRRIEDDLGVAGVLNALGTTARNRGHLDEADGYYQESLTLYRQIGDTVGMSVVLNNMGTAALAAGELERAAELQEESLALRRRAGDLWGVANLLNNMGDVACALGNLDRAQLLCDESLSLRRELGDQYGCAAALTTMGDIARARGDDVHAARCYAESLSTSLEQGDRGLVVTNIEGLAGVALQRGDSDRALRLLAAVAALTDDLHASMNPIARARFQRTVELARAAYAAHPDVRTMPADVVWELGRLLTFERAVAEALEEAAVSPSTNRLSAGAEVRR
ncbi:MAG TPA: tetratricopeptide repeat protein [Chloroflexota bacterium]|nr:tetratricopeptide repeat protein [Chloroflexota bacterium]